MSEFLGTSLLLSAVVFTHSPIMVVAALAIALGSAPSGHINPAITAVLLLVGKIGKTRAMHYLASQLSAAVFVWFASRVA
jgi:glycerol uptake facilitator-like aquaporin